MRNIATKTCTPTKAAKAIKAAPVPETPAAPSPCVAEPSPPEAVVAAAEPPTGKLGQLVALLQRPQGADIGDMMQATGWQAHSVRGAMSGALKKKRRLIITSQKTEAGRIYKIAAGEVQ